MANISLKMAMLFVAAALSTTTVYAGSPTQVSLVVNPHPDDEMEVWSLVEGSSSNYKVFMYLTRGEETGYCVTTTYNNSLRTDLGEVRPPYTPSGKWSASCVESRIASTLNFLNNMGSSDSSIPTGFVPSSYSVVSPATNGAALSHVDNGVSIADASVRVYNATNGMGKVLFFNLGDGDLTRSEVEWAIRSVKNNPSLFGIPAGLPFYNAIGSFANSMYTSCTPYSHSDHKAVHSALFSTNFGFKGYQTAATCLTDPDVSRTKDVSTAAWDRAWKIESNYQRTGYAQKNYGWLNNSLGGWAVGYGANQKAYTPFMQRQSFWQRF
ncbi:hypothetical protein EOL96_08110 [Candidatus Saccharibacteria bacterium]|nr:hypothetical protein [Candidatus Saccharibacteria bacterium]